MCELSAKHKTILVLVVQLQTFQEVLIAALVFVFLGLAVDGKELFKRKLLLALLLGTTEFLDGGKCGVGVERPQKVAKVEGIDLAVALEIVDGEGEGCPLILTADL